MIALASPGSETIVSFRPPPTGAATLSLSSVLEELVAAKRVQGRSEGQLQVYRHTIGTYTRWLEDRDTPATMDALTPRTVRLFLGWLAEYFATPNAKPWAGSFRPFGRRSIREWTITLKSFSKWAWREELIDVDQLARLALPAKERKEIRIFTDAQLRALTEQAAKHPRWYAKRNVALLLFLLDTLARVSEACGLTLNRLELDYAPDLGRALLWGSKTKAERWVYLAPETVAAIREYLVLGERIRRCDAVFVSVSGPRKGLPLARNAVRLMIGHLGKAAGVRGVRCSPHTLRHTGATMYARRGVNAAALQELLGHSTLDMTMHYLHLAQADVESIARAAAPTGALTGWEEHARAVSVDRITALHASGESVRSIARATGHSQRTVAGVLKEHPVAPPDRPEGADLVEAARRLGTTSKALRSRLERGTLSGTKVGARWYVRVAASVHP